MPEDIRWQQRLDNFLRAFARLAKAVELATHRELTDLEEQGLIQSFEYTHELAWKTLKDYLTSKGYTDIVGSKDSVRTAFREGIIDDGQAWMDMIKMRNLTPHTYDESLAKATIRAVIEDFFPVLHRFAEDFQRRVEEERP